MYVVVSHLFFCPQNGSTQVLHFCVQRAGGGGVGGGCCWWWWWLVVVVVVLLLLAVVTVTVTVTVVIVLVVVERLPPTFRKAYEPSASMKHTKKQYLPTAFREPSESSAIVDSPLKIASERLP